MSPPPPRLPSFTMLALPIFVPGALVVLAIAGYLTLTLDAQAELRQMGVAYCAVMYAVCVPMDVWWIASLRRRVARLEAALARGARLADLPRDDAIAALTIHRPAFWLVLGQWAVPALGLPFYLTARGAPVGREAAIGVVMALGLGTMCAIVVYYAYYLLVRSRVAPVLLVDGNLAALGAAPLTRAWSHIVRLIIALGVVQPATAGAMLALGARDVVVIGYLGFMLLVLAAFQVRGVMHSISRPAGHLAERMAEVREGRLGVRARIDNLDTFGQLASDFNEMVEGLRQRELLRETFGRYVTKQVAEEILAGRVALGGERRVATVLFSDIRGFTRMSERMAPEEVVAFLNGYLDMMVSCVFDHGGVLDKFIGDAVMAVFGAPVSKGAPEDDARAAVACALEMSRRLDAMNEERAARGEVPIEIGIGLSSGELVAGNIGSPLRMQYTVIGDTVNLSSRLEGLTKELGRRILVAESTALLAGDAFPFESLERVSVRGREQTVQVYALPAQGSAAA